MATSINKRVAEYILRAQNASDGGKRITEDAKNALCGTPLFYPTLHNLLLCTTPKHGVALFVVRSDKCRVLPLGQPTRGNCRTEQFLLELLTNHPGDCPGQQQSKTLFNKVISAILVALMFGICFTIAGIADNTVNEDWNRIHNPAVPVTIETHYIIDGNEYIIAVDDVDAIVSWEGDIPTLDIVNK